MGKLNGWLRGVAADYVVGVGVAIVLTTLARYQNRREHNSLER